MNPGAKPPSPHAHRIWLDDPDAFSTHRVGRLRHDFHRHPLLQLPALATLARSLADTGQCRFIRPDITQASTFSHEARHPDGRDIEEVFARIEEPGSWVALYNVQTEPAYAALLADIMATVRPLVEREQRGIFLVTGFIFVSAPPSVTPFHIDRENNFWLQLHGRKTMNVWDAGDRAAVPIQAVEDFIAGRSQQGVRFREEIRAHSHEFDTGPGDGIYFPSTSPHMTRSERGWTRPGDGVCVSLGVNFYTEFTRRTAQVHQFNRILRRMGLTPAAPGLSPLRDRIKAPLGRWVAHARYRRLGIKPPPGAC